MAIRESSLPTTDNVLSSDFIRCVTSDGASKKVAVPNLAGAMSSSIVNVASFAEGGLTSSNIADAITASLQKSSCIYIPAGYYTFNVTISQDCTIVLDRDCYIKTANASPAISFTGCSAHMIGGNVCFGTGESDESRTGVVGGFGIIKFENCTHSSISNLTVPYSRYTTTIWVRNTDGFVLEDSSFKHILRSAMFIDGHCRNVTVRNCRFEDSDTKANEDYCYFVYTGFLLNAESTTTVPVDGLIYENNLCIDSEDCALDTHGATNVIIRNNTVLDTVCAITAYNDNRRMGRPEGWKMRNILIENNYCESSKTIRAGSAYPHPFLFIGSSNTWQEGNERPSDTLCNAYATYDDFVNCIVRNNFFGTSNNYSTSGDSDVRPLYFNQFSRNLVFENNLIDLHGNDRILNVTRSINCRVRNNKVQNGSLMVRFIGSCGDVENNTGCAYNYDLAHISYMKGANGDIYNTYRTPTVALGDIIYIGGAKVSTYVGVCSARTYDDDIKTFSISVANGVATVTRAVTSARWEHNIYIPRLRLVLTNASTQATSNAYINDVIDLRHFTITDSDGDAVANGTYTATISDATLIDLQ